MGLLYSCILMVHGWRLDPIFLFSQVLISISALVKKHMSTPSISSSVIMSSDSPC